MLKTKITTNESNLRDRLITFNDGVCYLYEANERKIINNKGKFNFKNESIGIAHYFQAYNNNISLDMAISIPYNNITIDTQDIVEINGIYYRISRIQFHDNKSPKYWTLSLTKQPFSYEV